MGGTVTDIPVTFELFDALLEVDEFGDPDTFIGTFTLTSDMGDFVATTSGTLYREDLPGETGVGLTGLAGTFEIVSGTGFFDGLPGGGVITAIGIGDDAGAMQVMLAGFVVPAPASFALLGAAGLMTRRRRRA